MSELKKLASRLMTLDDKLIFCMKCGNLPGRLPHVRGDAHGG